MFKRNNVIAAYAALAAAPAAKDFDIEGDFADIVVNVRTLTGTAPTIQVTVVELVDKRLTLQYDGQASNFTVGRTVIGERSGARGLIVSDTDGGASGTLILKNVQGNFFDNEGLVEDGQPRTTKAFVNNATGGTETYTELAALFADSGTLNATGSTKRLVVDPAGTAGHRETRPLVNRKFRLKYTGGGTITNLTFDVELFQRNAA